MSQEVASESNNLSKGKTLPNKYADQCLMTSKIKQVSVVDQNINWNSLFNDSNIILDGENIKFLNNKRGSTEKIGYLNNPAYPMKMSEKLGKRILERVLTNSK